VTVPRKQCRGESVVGNRIVQAAGLGWLGGTLSALLLLILVAPLRAEPIAQLHRTNYVNDFASVLNPETTKDLNDLCQQLDRKAHALVAVVTVGSLDGRNVDSYTSDLFKFWDMATIPGKRGVLILISVEDHAYATQVGGGNTAVLPNRTAASMWNESAPLIQRGNYNDAVNFTTQRVAAVVAQNMGIRLTTPRHPVARSQDLENSQQAPVWLFITAGMILAVMIVMLVLTIPIPITLRDLAYYLAYGRRGYGYSAFLFGYGPFGGGRFGGLGRW
jgi:uncharacterized protein